MALLDRLVEPFPHVEIRDVVGVLRESVAFVDPRLARLDTERDDTFRVDHATGTHLVKVAHPNDPPALLDAQDAALAAAAAAGLPVPELVARATLDGRVVRVLTWLSGAPGSRPPLRDTGRLLGRLSRALAPVEHPGADRVLAWDLRRVPELADYTDEPLLADAIARFAAEVSPVLEVLPRQVAHHDLHPGNVLTDGGQITGILDFGDLVRTARVCDLGVALGYLIPDDGSGRAVRDEFVAGFEEAAPLSAEERDVIPGLVVGRELQRIVINEQLGRSGTGSFDAARVRRTLARALEDWT